MKKIYKTPELKKLDSIRTLTQSNNRGSSSDHAVHTDKIGS